MISVFQCYTTVGKHTGMAVPSAYRNRAQLPYLPPIFPTIQLVLNHSSFFKKRWIVAYWGIRTLDGSGIDGN